MEPRLDTIVVSRTVDTAPALKKIPRDVGEYVAFTEYESQTAADSGQASSARKTRTESQITDVEWVDIEK